MGLDLLPFLGITALVMAVPGPSVLYAVTLRLEHGRTAGAVAVLGLETGLLVHVLAACLGVSALIAASPSVLTVLRFAGAGYLVVLGLRQLGLTPRQLTRHRPSGSRPLPLGSGPAAAVTTTPPAGEAMAGTTALLAPTHAAPTVRLWAVFRAGLLIDLLNPKTVLFFLALVPQFVPAGALTASAAAVMVSCVVGLGVLFDGGYATLAGGLQRRGLGAVGRWVPSLTGGCFLALGVVALLG